MSNHRVKSEMRLMLTFIAGIVVGFSFAQIFSASKRMPNLSCGRLDSFADWAGIRQEQQQQKLAEGDHTADVTASPFDSSLVHPPDTDDTTLADHLFNETRVLCWVLTGPKNHADRAAHVKRTWGARCNKLIFMSSEEDVELGAVKLPVREGRDSLWHKTREALTYLYLHHRHEADWFLKADDDTYVILENLRAFLNEFSTEAPVYFGCKFKPYVRQGYMSGGAGYVLSKEALRRFVEQALGNRRICKRNGGGSEDKELGICLQNVGVVAGDSRDDQKRGRFFPSAPEKHLSPENKDKWYWPFYFYAAKDGPNCCSDYAISFHYVRPTDFYVFDYFLYRLRVFGIRRRPHQLPTRRNTTELLEEWRNGIPDSPLITLSEVSSL